MNLIEGIQQQCNRARKIIPCYIEMGDVGVYGKTIIEVCIAEGESAIASGDVIRMLTAYKNLEEIED